MNAGAEIMTSLKDDRFLNLLEEWFKDLRADVKANTNLTQKAYSEAKSAHKQAKTTNGKVAEQEKRISALETRKLFQPDPKLLYTVAVGFVVLLFIIAKLLNVQLPGGI